MSKIKLIENGPAIVTGTKILPNVEVTLESGELLVDKVVAVCRCGKSKNHPFCDGSHSNK